VSGWVVGVSLLTYTTDWYSLNTTVNLYILYTVCFFVPPVIFTPLLYLFTSLCSCVRTVINLLTWWAEYGKSVGGTETKCKEGQGARHYEMLCNL